MSTKNTPVTCVKCGLRASRIAIAPGVGQGANNSNLGTCRNRIPCARRQLRKGSLHAIVSSAQPGPYIEPKLTQYGVWDVKRRHFVLEPLAGYIRKEKASFILKSDAEKLADAIAKLNPGESFIVKIIPNE